MEAWLQPMLCGKTDEVPVDGRWVLEGKLDGWRLVCHRAGGTVHTFGGRNGSDYTGKVPYIEQALLDVLPPDSAVDGELVGDGWGDVQGVMTRGHGPHVPSLAVPALSYVVFDITRMFGEDLRSMPWTQRRALLEQAFADAGDGLRVSPVGDCSEESHQAMLALGLEGSVVKRRDGRYVNTRSNLWLKIKPQETAEARVVGFKPGTEGSAFDGLVGALELEMLDGGARTRASGFDMALRRQITANKADWLGVVVEIKHHGISKDGVPRHPQFLRRRDDRADESPRPTTRRTPRVSPQRMRNYGAMKDAKLLGCIEELRARKGAAFDRAEASGIDPAQHLDAAEQAARERDLL